MRYKLWLSNDELFLMNWSVVMNLYSLAIPGGIVTYVVILFTVLTGLKIIHIKSPRRHFQIHRTAGIMGIILGSIHAAIIIYFNFF